MIQTRDWIAWLNLQPPPPDDLHVIGQVQVGNPGVVAILIERVPPGINPQHLHLELHLLQRPGFWIQRLTWTDARFSKVYPPGGTRPSRVGIFHDGRQIASEDIVIVQ